MLPNNAKTNTELSEGNDMINFVGAGPGAPDLITLRGSALLKEADVVIYAGSLVNPALLGLCREDCRIYNSAEMTLEQVVAVFRQAEAEQKNTVRLHTGDPCVYGAIREQMDALDELGLAYAVTPGVSSFCGAAAAAQAEYTLPDVSQSVILTRMAGRTPVPERESIAALAAHGTSMVVFLSSGMLEGLQAELLKGAYTPDTPAALVYKATWPEEKVLRCTVGTLAETGAKAGVRKTALVLVGDFLNTAYARSKLYDPSFATEFRPASAGDAPAAPVQAAPAPAKAVTLIGIGCGTEATMTAEAAAALRKARLILGASRMLESLPKHGLTAPCRAAYLPEDILQHIQQAQGDVCVLYSGDSGFYSGARGLLPLLQGYEVRVFPGISSLQALAARLGRPWQDWRLCSAHGVDCDPVAEVCQGKPVFFLTGGKQTPDSLCRALAEAGLGDLPVTVAEDLTADTERIQSGAAGELAKQTFSGLSVLLAEAAPRMSPRSPGLPDESFERLESIPMTKQEVRAVALAKLAVAPTDLCWDVGAGSGSVGIELAMTARSVWAVERSPEAAALAEQNRRKLGAWNLHIVTGSAPQALEAFPPPDKVFVGGSGGKLADILSLVRDKNPRARVCVAAIALETLQKALETLGSQGYTIDVTQVAAARSRKAVGLHLMQAQNPIYLITGTPAEESL